MKLNKEITLQQPPYTASNGTVVKPEPITYTELDITYIIRPITNTAYAQINGIPSPIMLFENNNMGIITLTMDDLQNILLNKLGDDPQTFLQSLFPKTLESDPDGPGSILSGMIATMGIKTTPTCSCKRHALQMNEKGNEWCEQNMPTILAWLKEESTKRNLPFIETVAKMIVQRAIKTSRRLKAKNVK
jgi:hypothetical protein